MRSKGWYDRPGVEIFEGRWQDWAEQLEDEDSGGVGLFDAVYWDTVRTASSLHPYRTLTTSIVLRALWRSIRLFRHSTQYP